MASPSSIANAVLSANDLTTRYGVADPRASGELVLFEGNSLIANVQATAADYGIAAVTAAVRVPSVFAVCGVLEHAPPRGARAPIVSLPTAA